MISVSILFFSCGLLLIGLANACNFKRDVVITRLTAVSNFSHVKSTWLSSWQFKGDKYRHRKLVLIGWSNANAETQFLSIRYLLMIVAGVIWHATQTIEFNVYSLSECIASAIVTGIAVDLILDWRVNQVRNQISRVVPDAVDLMVICVASGLTLESVFRCVGEEMRSISPALSREWLLTAAEISVLDSPQQALINLDERIQLPDINNVVTTMNQALQFGTPLAQALSLIASDSRQYHFLELEEWVGKIPAKMSLPLVVLIMLPVVVMITAPIMLGLMESLGDL